MSFDSYIYLYNKLCFYNGGSHIILIPTLFWCLAFIFIWAWIKKNDMHYICDTRHATYGYKVVLKFKTLFHT